MALIYSDGTTQTTTGTNGADLMFSVGSRSETLDGAGGHDTIFGLGGNDQLSGGSGNDVLYGDGREPSATMNGSDHLNGGSGSDVLYGGGSGDFLTGGTGSDTLYGGTGNDYLRGDGPEDGSVDWLYGGAGIDKFWWLNDGDHAFGGSGGDDFRFGRARGDVWIDDYQAGADKLHLPTTNYTVSGDGLTIAVDRVGEPDLTIHLSSALDPGDIIA